MQSRTGGLYSCTGQSENQVPVKRDPAKAGANRKLYGHHDYGRRHSLKNQTAAHFIIPGAGNSVDIQDNLILLPENSEFFHPDLINASDAVIGKVGYSTIAEVYHAGIPFGYSARANYRESEPLVNFIENKMHGFAISPSEFDNGDWIHRIADLLALPRVQRDTPNGAGQIAGFIANLLK
jgi:hypothetical protein